MLRPIKTSRVFSLCATIVLAVSALAMTGCLGSPSMLTVPMEHRPTSRVNTSRFAGSIPSSAKVFIAPVIDSRADMMTIGANREDAKPIPVLAATPPAEYFHRAVSTELSTAGLMVNNSASGSTHTLTFELVRFNADESPSYRADIVARAKLIDAKGTVRWEGSVNGYGTRFGRSLSAENYQEVLSDSIIMLVEGLLSNSSFQTALK